MDNNGAWFGQSGSSPYGASSTRRSIDDISPTSQASYRYFHPQAQRQDVSATQSQYRHSISLEVPTQGYQQPGYQLSRKASNRSHSSAQGPNSFTGQEPVPSSHAIQRFQQEENSPWAALPNLEFQPDLQLPQNQLFDLGTYRDADTSEVLSDTSHPAHQADSAYVSQTGQSIYSVPVDPSNISDGIDPNLGGGLRIDDTSTVRSSITGSQQGRSRRPSRAGSTKKYVPKQCKYCQDIPKCESDYKKHMLKHEKQFCCRVKGCRRGRSKEGFGTINDLFRHVKSVHKLKTPGNGTKSFRCVAKGCEKIDKMWPRLDNFKQHVIRIHKAEHDGDEKAIASIVERSEIKPISPQQPQPIAPQMPLNEALAGMDNHLQPPLPMENSNGYNTVSPENIMTWTPGMEAYRPSEEQGIFSSQYATGPLRPEQLSKDGQAIQQYLPSTSIDEGRQNINNERNGRESMDDPLNTLASAAVMANPTPTVTFTPVTMADQQRDVEMTEMSRVSSCRRSQEDQGQLNEPAGSSVGRSPSPSEKSVLSRVFSMLEGQVDREQVLEVLKDHLGTEGKRSGRAKSNGSFSSSINESGHTCPICLKKLNRSCDMKKHMKRHTRPYGCTFPRCHKVFGSKNDWKRHENSQHFQQEMWRCQFEPTKGGTRDGKCGQVFYYADRFSAHLRNTHHMPREQREEMKQNCRIGRSGHTRFWCGFCKDIIPVSGIRGQAAWDERFNHIDEKHYKHKQKIDNWLCIETKTTKGEQQDGMKRQPLLDEMDMGGNRNGFDNMSDDANGSLRTETPPDTPPGTTVPSSVMQNGDGQSSQFGDAHEAALFHCCRCGTGPYNNLYSQCIMGEDCGHEFCPKCFSTTSTGY